jgi:hypothetical protein
VAWRRDRAARQTFCQIYFVVVCHVVFLSNTIGRIVVLFTFYSPRNKNQKELEKNCVTFCVTL